MMAMSLNNFKLLKEDGDSYHVQHPFGKTVVVPKKGLSEKAHAMIKKMAKGGEVPCYADGGDVQPNVSDQPPAALQANPEPESTPEPAPSSPAPQAPPQDPLTQKGLDTEGLLNKEEADLQALQKSEQSAFGAQGEAYKDYIGKLNNMQTPNDISKAYQKKDDALLKSYLDHNIDPDRYVKNMSTPSKIAAGIAMIFGGMGQGLIGGRNPALDHLNTAIAQDIEAQKNDQGKALNLYKMNREAMGDDIRASIATQNQLWTGAQAKISMAGAAAQSAVAKQRAQQAVNDIEQMKIQNRMRLGLLSQGANGGGASQADPLNLVPELVPKEHQQAAIKEVGQAQAAVKNEDEMMRLFDQAQKENTVLRTGAGMLRTPASMLSLQALGDPLIHDQDGRVNEFEKQDFNNLLPHPGDTDAKIAEKRKGLIAFINNKKAAPTAKAYGINVENFASTASDPIQRLSPQQRQYYDWAKANPKSPVAQAFFKKTGLK
jgi:hypothetical protein